MKGRNPLESRARDVGGILSCGDSPVRGAFSFGRTASRRANQSYSVFWKTRARAKIRGIIINRTDHIVLKIRLARLTARLGQWYWGRTSQHSCPQTSAPPNCCWSSLGHHWPLTLDPNQREVGCPCWSIERSQVCEHVTAGQYFFMCTGGIGEYPAIRFLHFADGGVRYRSNNDPRKLLLLLLSFTGVAVLDI